MATGKRHMTDRDQLATDPGPTDLSARLEEAINNLSLGIVIFDAKREVVFCNSRYIEMYGLSPEQVKPGTPTSELIQHRLDLGLKVRTSPDEYIRERVGRDIALDTTIQEFTVGDGDAQVLHRRRAVEVTLADVLQHNLGHALSLHSARGQPGDNPSLEN